jgi:hypothetical protein
LQIDFASSFALKSSDYNITFLKAASFSAIGCKVVDFKAISFKALRLFKA